MEDTKTREVSEQNKTSQQTKLLFRSHTKKMLAGVAGGIADYFAIDPNIIRLFFILLTIFGGSGVLLYLILWIILPTEGHIPVSENETIKENINEMKQKVQGFTEELKQHSRPRREGPQLWLGIVIVILGILFLLNNLGLLDFFEIRKYWPVLLVFFGIYIVSRNE